MIDETVLALDSAECELANLLTVETLPPLAIELLVELQNENWVNKINERIAYVAFVLRRSGNDKITYLIIYREIEEVVLVSVILVNLLEQHLLSVLVRDVLHHDSSPGVSEVQQAVQVDLKL